MNSSSNTDPLAKGAALEGHGVTHSSGAAELSVVTYPRTLLSTASDLLRQGQCGISVVVSHMACEVAAERALTESFINKGLAYLEEPVFAFLNGYNLASDRNRKLYSALTGDEIHTQPFWQAFKESSARRNDVMHKGRIIAAPEAEASLAAAKLIIEHLER